MALESLQKALSANPNNVIALLRAGVLYSTKKEYTTAQSYFEDVANLDQGGQFGDEAKERLETIKREMLLAGSGTTSTGNTSESGVIQ